MKPRISAGRRWQHSPVVRGALFALFALIPPGSAAGAQSPRTCRAAEDVVHRAAASESSFVTGLETSIRQEADRHIADLTMLAAVPGGCPAAIALRGLVKWGLIETGWHPNEGMGQRAGVPWSEGAVRDLAHAAQSDGVGSGDAAVLAMRALVALGARANALTDEVGPWLLGTLAASSTDTTRQLALGRIAIRVSRPELADSALRRYFDLGGKADLARLELARVELGLGRAGADTLYYKVAASADTATRAGLLHDLAFVADSAELAAFGSLEPAARPAWLRTFWEDRDLASLRPRGSRLLEHYRRIAYAREHYHLRQYPRRYETFELWRHPDAELDDRGLIYVRHGVPDDSAAAISPDACPNVTWLYRRPEGNLIFNFSARDDPDDWRLLETLDNAGGGNGATNRLRVRDSCGPVEGLFSSRAQIDPVYAKLALREQLGVRQNRLDFEDELAITTRSRKVGTTTDSYELRFAHPVRTSRQSYALFGRGGSPGLVLSVLSAAVADLRVGPDSVARLRLHVVATGGARSVEHDTTHAFRVAGGRESWVTIADETPLAPGAWSFGLALRASDSTGQYFRAVPLDVPAAGGGLALSDIVAAQESGGHRWAARDGALNLNPMGTYRVGQSVLLYYEVGAGGSSAIRTRIELSDGRRTTTAAFSEPGQAGVAAFRRSLATAGLRTGTIAITVTVTDGGGGSATRRLDVRLVK